MDPRILKALVDAKIELFGSSSLVDHLAKAQIPMSPLTTSYHHEYSDTKMTVLVVEDLDAAITHINTFGSGHTESIITEVCETQ